MSIKERLKTAYENIAYDADKTWVHNSYTYQRANQELICKEYQLQLTETVELRPRTVKDCIPRSKLAQYSNYEYNEARELSYAPSNSSFSSFTFYSKEPKNHSSTEPWLLPEVEDLFIWFTSHQNFEDQMLCNNIQKPQQCVQAVYKNDPFVEYESPILKVDTFDKRVLKMQICSDRIKNIWHNVNVRTISDCIPITKDKMMNVYKTPAFIFYLSSQGDEMKDYQKEEFLKRFKVNDFEHLKFLSKSFKEQNCWMLHYLTNHIQPSINPHDLHNPYSDLKADSLPTRRLYSAVLQGSNTCNKKSPPAKTEHFIPLVKIQKKINKNSESLSVPNYKQHHAFQFSSSKIQENTNMDLGESCLPSSLLKEINADYKIDAEKTLENTANSSNIKVAGKIKYPESVTSTAHFTSTNSSPTYSFSTAHMQSALPHNSPANPLTSPYTVSPSYLSNYSYQVNSHLNNNCQMGCIYTNTFSTNMSQIVITRNLQSIPNHNCLFGTYQLSSPVIMLQKNRTSNVYPISQQYIQQSYYGSNIVAPRPIQRWIQSDFARPSISQQNFPQSVPPHFIPQPPAHWIGQSNNQMMQNTQFTDAQMNKLKTKKRRILQSVSSIQQEEMRTKLLINDKSNCVGDDLMKYATKSSGYSETETMVLSDLNTLLEDNSEDAHVPVASSLSEELEIQALEQYSSSNDNVYQELERQAEEQYENNCSENWKSPPSDMHTVRGAQFLIRDMYGLDIK